MLDFKGMRFPIDVILVCIRWYRQVPCRVSSDRNSTASPQILDLIERTKQMTG
ncbi:hypothetical protein OX459_25710 [Janthinobacterium sp. SUN026]|uniref:hypothetical protein n=1 Tax=Janthinobacterium sp. SUN026 TaxID=3002438 RepID=UPI0025B264C7|nr:hypothetical protein [Janthinobacterium sp. SUN026]MDN2674797.1 hypothetical protein [Janthinobacterium sp. SUN026]